ncbi:MAG: hypothetical protein ACOH2M_32815 [Cypionkella sp.]
MNKLQALRSNLSAKFYGGQAVVFTGLMASPYLAFAAADPSVDIVAEINKGKGYGVAAAVAFVVAVWAITSIHMSRRKG